MKIVRKDFGIRLTCMVGRNRKKMDYLSRRRVTKRRRARFLARLPLLARVRALMSAAPEPAPVRIGGRRWR